MSQLVRLRGKHTCQTAHCALVEVSLSVRIMEFVGDQMCKGHAVHLGPSLSDASRDSEGGCGCACVHPDAITASHFVTCNLGLPANHLARVIRVPIPTFQTRAI